MGKTAMFGGTFNPIHNGHLHLAQSYAELLKLDRILFIPTKSPPHKQVEHLASVWDRLEMCKLAVEGMPHFSVSDIEVNRREKSYTVLTLETLKERFPTEQLYLLVGGDMFLTIQNWYRAADIFKLATVCTAAREPDENDKLTAHAPSLERMGAKTIVLNIRAMKLSSTEVRDALKKQRPVEGMVPEKVANYIRERQLYGAGSRDEYAGIRVLLREKLTPKRYEHSLCVADEAARLARLYGEDEKRAYLAGLLHDICKDMAPEEQLQTLSKSDIILDSELMTQPEVWHGYAGAAFLREQLHMQDKQIIDAVMYHTTARADMGTLEKIIYLADLTSRDRHYHEIEVMREKVDVSLDEAMRESLAFIVQDLERKGLPVCKDTRDAYREFCCPVKEGS